MAQAGADLISSFYDKLRHCDPIWFAVVRAGALHIENPLRGTLCASTASPQTSYVSHLSFPSFWPYSSTKLSCTCVRDKPSAPGTNRFFASHPLFSSFLPPTTHSSVRPSRIDRFQLLEANHPSRRSTSSLAIRVTQLQGKLTCIALAFSKDCLHPQVAISQASDCGGFSQSCFPDTSHPNHHPSTSRGKPTRSSTPQKQETAAPSSTQAPPHRQVTFKHSESVAISIFPEIHPLRVRSLPAHLHSESCNQSGHYQLCFRILYLSAFLTYSFFFFLKTEHISPASAAFFSCSISTWKLSSSFRHRYFNPILRPRNLLSPHPSFYLEPCFSSLQPESRLPLT